MFLQQNYRSCSVPGFGFVRWLNLSLTEHSVPDWVIGPYIVMYIEESYLDPPPKSQVKKVAFPDWHDEIWINISISLHAKIEVIIL
ncbi:hypothetical protein DFH28DRAFT_910934 [Melampsora americana]|nr:hypothetical protein DFH28DRAFT_910934 [Melampsora americana]